MVFEHGLVPLGDVVPVQTNTDSCLLKVRKPCRKKDQMLLRKVRLMYVFTAAGPTWITSAKLRLIVDLDRCVHAFGQWEMLFQGQQLIFNIDSCALSDATLKDWPQAIF